MTSAVTLPTPEQDADELEALANKWAVACPPMAAKFRQQAQERRLAVSHQAAPPDPLCVYCRQTKGHPYHKYDHSFRAAA